MSAQATEAQRLETLAQELLERAKAAGADDAEVFAGGGRSLGAKVEKGDLGQVHTDEGSTLGLRVLVDGRLGFASTNQSDTESLRGAASDAVAIARLSPPDPANVFPEPSPIDDAMRTEPGVDPSLANIDVAEVVEHAHGLAQRAVGVDPRVSVDQASVSVVAASRLVMSTRGVHQRDFDSAVTLSMMALATDGDDTGGFDYGGTVLRRHADVASEVQRLAGEVAEACIGNLGAGSGKSYEGPVAFAPAAFASSLLSPLLGGISAIAVQRGRSALAERMGEPIGRHLELFDDPGDRELAGATAFDREGVPARRFPLVEGGVLKAFLHNTYSAAVDGVTSTGHAKGGPRGVPGLGAHALVVGTSDPAAPADEAALLKALGTGLYVQRFSGSVDAASGDFSGAAKSARWVENGQVVRSVNEVMLAGNAFDLLRDHLTLSRASERLGGANRIPWALVDGIHVTCG